MLLRKKCAALAKKIKWPGLVAGVAAVILAVPQTSTRQALASELTGSGNAPSFSQVRTLKVGKPINAVAWNDDSSQLAALSDYGSTLTIWNTNNWEVLNEFKRSSNSYSFNSLAYLPNGHLVTAAPLGPLPIGPRSNGEIRDDTLQVFSMTEWDTATGKIVGYFPPPAHVDASVKVTETFTISKDGTRIAGITGPDEVLVYDTSTHSLVIKISVSSSLGRKDVARSLSFSNDGKQLAVGTMEGSILLFGTLTGKLLHSYEVYPNGSYSCADLAFGPDDSLIASGSTKNMNLPTPSKFSTQIWQANSGSLVAQIVGATWLLNGTAEPASSRTLSWSSFDRESILAVGDDRSLRVYNVDNDRPVELVNKPLDQGSYSASFSASGLLAAAANNEILIYQPQSRSIHAHE